MELLPNVAHALSTARAQHVCYIYTCSTSFSFENEGAHRQDPGDLSLSLSLSPLSSPLLALLLLLSSGKDLNQASPGLSLILVLFSLTTSCIIPSRGGTRAEGMDGYSSSWPFLKRAPPLPQPSEDMTPAQPPGGKEQARPLQKAETPCPSASFAQYRRVSCRMRHLLLLTTCSRLRKGACVSVKV